MSVALDLVVLSLFFLLAPLRLAYAVVVSQVAVVSLLFLALDLSDVRLLYSLVVPLSLSSPSRSRCIFLPLRFSLFFALSSPFSARSPTLFLSIDALLRPLRNRCFKAREAAVFLPRTP